MLSFIDGIRRNERYFMNIVRPKVKLPSFGFEPSQVEKNDIKNDIDAYANNGGVPELWLDARGVNENIAPFSQNLLGAAWSSAGTAVRTGATTFTSGITTADCRLNLASTANNLPAGNYRVRFDMRAVTPGTYTCAVDIGDGPSVSVNVTNAMQTFDIIVSKTVNNRFIDFNPEPAGIDFELTNVYVTRAFGQYYKPRIDEALVQPTNLGINNNNTFTFVNYGEGELAASDVATRKFIPFSSSKIQRIPSNSTAHNNKAFFAGWILPIDNGLTQCIFNKGSGSTRGLIQGISSTQFRFTFNSDSSSLIDTNNYNYGQIYHIAYAWDASASTAQIYVNGVLTASSSSIVILPNTAPYEVSRSALPLSSPVYQAVFGFRELTPSQALNIFNAQKSRYGL
jgi:hypothetical protein